MEADSSIAIQELRVDGATINNMLMQFQSDVTGVGGRTGGL
jgi:glycerol kinase